MRGLYLLIGLVMIGAGAFALGSSLDMFFNFPGLLITFGGASLFTLAAHGAGDLGSALVTGFSNTAVKSDDVKKHAQVLQTLRTTLLASGGVGILVGLVQILVTLGEPSKIGPAAAVAVLSVFYGLLTAELVMAPAVHRVRNKAISP